MSLNELMSVVSPPPNPIETGNESQKDSIEAKLGTPLPDDYWEFGQKYGSGRFADSDRVYIGVLNPFSPVFFQELDSELKRLRSAKEMLRGHSQVPYNVFPDKPGLLPWGGDDGGGEFYWLVEGDPNSWPIVRHQARSDYGYPQVDLSMTTFLAKAFTRQISCILWEDPEFFSGPEPVVFEPTTQLHRIVLERT